MKKLIFFLTLSTMVCKIGGAYAKAFSENVYNDSTSCELLNLLSADPTAPPQLHTDAFDYIQTTFKKLDAIRVNAGDLEIIGQLDKDDWDNMVMLVSDHCARYPKETIYDTIAQLYTILFRVVYIPYLYN